MIRIHNLKKRYDRVWALKGISIEIAAGELFGFLGPNGAGKTTTMTIIAGLQAATEGTVEVAGFNVQTDALEVKRRLGYVPDRPYIYEKLTGRELLQLFADIYGMDQKQVDSEANRWLETFELQHKANDLIEGYSHGMKQRITMAATLMHDPDILVVDEPMVGLDPRGARLLKDLMRQRCARGKTVLMSTHTLQVAEETCDRVGIIHQGEIIGVGTIDELRQQFARDGDSLEEIFLAMTAGD